MPIDHTNSSVGTYKNRYWVQEEYYQQGGPVFIYDVGESTAESAAKVQLGNSTSMFVEMLAENGAMGIVWEHRSVTFDLLRSSLTYTLQVLRQIAALQC